MQNVSAKWKTEMQGIVAPEQNIKITIDNVNDRAQTSATISATNQFTRSSVDDLLNRNTLYADRFATFEKNKWSPHNLRSFTVAAPDDEYRYGYVSSVISANDFTYSSNPVITLQYISQQSAIDGITIVWSLGYEEFATDFVVRFYQNNTVLDTKTVTDNRAIVSFVSANVSNFTKVEIEIVKWCLPNSRARVTKIYLGSFIQFTKSDIITASLEQHINPISMELPKAALSFSIDNTSGLWTPENTNGYYAALHRNSKVSVQVALLVDGNYEWIDGGVYYLTSWNCPQSEDTAYFEARDSLCFMLSKPFDFTNYSASTSYSAKDVAEDCFNQAGITDYTVTLSGSITVDKDKIGDCTCAELLQYIANAKICELWQDRSGLFHCEAVSSFPATDYVITRNIAYKESDYDIAEDISAVYLNGNLIASFVGGTLDQTCYNPLVVGFVQELAYANYIRSYLSGLKQFNGEFRADTRLDAGDMIQIELKSGTMFNVRVTDIEYSFDGAFKGKYTAYAKSPT